jgi:hypothetical protein
MVSEQGKGRPGNFVQIASGMLYRHHVCEAFLGHCIDQVNRTAHARAWWLLDNVSTDRSTDVATARGAEIIVKNFNPPQALNALPAMSEKR